MKRLSYYKDSIILNYDTIIMFIVFIFYIIIQINLYIKHKFPILRGETDGIGYMERATGDFFQINPFHGPGYSWAIRLIDTLPINTFASAKIISILFGILFIYSSYLIFVNYLGKNYSILAMITLAFAPITLVRSNYIMSDMMASALFLSLIAILLGEENASNKKMFMAGIIAGLAYLTRYIYILGLLIPIVYLLLRKYPFYKQYIYRYISFLTGFLIITSPWLYVLYLNKGSFFWNHNYLNIAFAMYGKHEGWNAFPSPNEYSGLFDVFMSNPILFLKNWIKTFLKSPWYLTNILPWSLFFAVVGFFYWLYDLNKSRLFFLIINFLYLIVVSLVWLEDRFLITNIPFIVLLSIITISYLPDMYKNLHYKTTFYHSIKIINPRCICITCLLIFSLGYSSYHTPQSFDNLPMEFKKAANFIGSHYDQNISILTSKPHIPFFSNNKFLDYRDYNLQNKDISEFFATLKDINPDIFIYDQRYSSVEFSQYKLFLSPNNNFHSKILKPVHVIKDPKKIVIYKYISAQESD